MSEFERTVSEAVYPGGSLSIGEDFDGILDAARSGEPWAFERLYRDLAPAVAGYLRLQGAAEPEDLNSDVFLGVFAGLSSFSGTEQQFRSWVFTIAHRRLVDERRRRTRKPSTPTGEPEVLDRPAGDAEQDAMAALGQRRVAELCAELSADQREVLLLRIVADLTVEQVAEVLGRSKGAVKALQRRGLTALRKKLSGEGVTL
ncbi:RNA polymerase sigma-70 factor (ECF subfamily) [Haloactinopolyspora alba]|uniref:RNA polymerase sigma-70 factor (ECF subfamily) n=1 Tax=Haloactinopolyspora alba TaxID=648780 RepID=A0A2P8DWD5_9ACTN|nr:sigma-70 family RNA polymerase sigma factor [Haloactinopolyspora alba]PSL01526.1 RNA polymerase sigma-70 factor (ECF subfamily) [Haloactinopolyspora alba]